MNRRRGFDRLLIAISVIAQILVTLVLYIGIIRPLTDEEYRIDEEAVKKLEKLCEVYKDYYNLPDSEKVVVVENYKNTKKYSGVIEFDRLTNEEQTKFIHLLKESINYYSIPKSTKTKETSFDIFISMIIAVICVIPIWVIYGLVIFVIRGFVGSEKKAGK